MPISIRKLKVLAIFLQLLLLMACQKSETNPKAQIFATPEDAAVAMIKALKAGSNEQLLTVFGPEAKPAISSGDPVADRAGRELIVVAYHEYSALDGGNDSKTLIIGNERWPFPVPIVKVSGGWSFDTAQGIDEILNRRIGRNELATIEACRTYVAAQLEYGGKGHDGKRSSAYAQKFLSTPGKQDGLFWDAGEGEEQSPLGALMAEAAAEGRVRSEGKQEPFRGYYFLILTAQGPSAQGGAKSYLKNGEMRGGFALVAYPATYKNSGIMSFMVNQDGVVYQKDLGPDTPRIAGEMTGYNPDSGWTSVD